jgi:hypothetical protein
MFSEQQTLTRKANIAHDLQFNLFAFRAVSYRLCVSFLLIITRMALHFVTKFYTSVSFFIQEGYGYTKTTYKTRPSPK